MGLTVSEKDHFKVRLNERVLELTGEILSGDQSWQRELTKQAVELTEQHYGLTEQLAELKKWNKRARAVARRVERIKTDIVAQARGMKPEHIEVTSTRHDSYGYRYQPNLMPTPALPEPFTDDDFKHYPGDSRLIIREHAQAEFKRMAREHTVGKRIAKLKEKAQEFQDRLVAAATHAQLQTTWKEITEEFNMLMEQTKERQPRKVETARNEAKGNVASGSPRGLKARK